MSFLNPWLIVQMYPALVFSIGIALVDIYMNWFKRFYFLILEGDLLITLSSTDYEVTNEN